MVPWEEFVRDQVYEEDQEKGGEGGGGGAGESLNQNTWFPVSDSIGSRAPGKLLSSSEPALSEI